MHTSTTSTVPLAPWTAEQLEQATQGNWLNNKKPADAIKRILTDSRDAEQGRPSLYARTCFPRSTGF